MRELPASLGLLGAVAIATAAAGQGLLRDDPLLDAPPTLPQSKIGTVRAGDGARPAAVNTIADVFRALEACWKPPASGGHSGREITVQFAFRRNGEVLGRPKITYFRGGTSSSQREAFANAVRAAFVDCTPLPFTERFGAAIAGQIFAIRFVDAPAR